MRAPAKVTLTGAGERTNLSWMKSVQAAQPRVEWGLLLYPEHVGESRYPSMRWLERAAAELGESRICLHLCGQAVGGLLSDFDGEVARLARAFGRVQLNVNARRFPLSAAELMDRIDAWGGDVILQMNEANAGLLTVRAPRNVAWLFDSSGGTGKRSAEWPDAIPGAACGWAGGLGPGNIAEELPRIAAKALGHYWTDCERWLRSDDDELSPARVETFMERVALCIAGDAAGVRFGSEASA